MAFNIALFLFFLAFGYLSWAFAYYWYFEPPEKKEIRLQKEKRDRLVSILRSHGITLKQWASFSDLERMRIARNIAMERR